MPDALTSGTFHTGITVSDLDRALEFYCGLLGLELVFRRRYEERYIFRLVAVPEATAIDVALVVQPQSGHRIELLQYVGADGRDGHGRPCDVGTAHLGFLVEDISAIVARLRSAEVDFLATEPVPIDAGPNSGGAGIYLRDPDGFLVELHQRAPDYVDTYQSTSLS